MACIGVMSLQGGFAAHIARLQELGHRTVQVRTAEALNGLDGLILPGGESTTHLKLIDRYHLRSSLESFVASGRPVLATCAGLILAARQVTAPSQPSFGWIDIAVARNAYGRQLDSFESVADEGELPLVFIRAPRIVEVGKQVEVLATLNGDPILVRQDNFTGATFHPELTDDWRVHRQVFGEGCGVELKPAA
ncbi:MAG: pyridoxal 5'-phosphate synthase glutaminase subunit PdxT [Bradymonadales bacterium]|nr:pyridoxal 5'-phosphate synthase glutaminase subunit PdxT [Bradymonadales bacterium]